MRMTTLQLLAVPSHSEPRCGCYQKQNLAGKRDDCVQDKMLCTWMECYVAAPGESYAVAVNL